MGNCQVLKNPAYVLSLNNMVIMKIYPVPMVAMSKQSNMMGTKKPLNFI
jgi:hypothetical protein